MAEYFEKEALIREIISDMALFMGDPDAVQEHDERCNYAISCIENAPAADVAPVRHGRWIDIDGDPVPWDKYSPSCPLREAYCSECGEWLAGSDEYPVIGLYCPKCGAKMDLEADHEVSEP